MEINTTKDFLHLRKAWNSLLPETLSPNPFLTWEWQFTCWEHFFLNKQLLILLAEEKKSLCGIAPLLVKSYIPPLNLKKIEFIGTGHSDYLDFIISPTNNPEKILHLFFEFLQKNISRWDIIDLHSIPSDSFTIKYFENTKKSLDNNISLNISTLDPCPRLLLPETWEIYLKTISKKMRWNINYSERNLKRKFNSVEITSVETDTEIDNTLHKLIELHQKRWQRKYLPGVFYSKKRRNFFVNTCKRFFTNGWLKIFLLKINENIEAAVAVFALYNKMFYYIGGFNPEFEKCSIGTIVVSNAIKKAIELKYAEFDFLKGDEPYKRRYGTQIRTTSQVEIFKHDIVSKTFFKINQFIEGVVSQIKAKFSNDR